MHALYRFFSSTGQLLYVGITCNPGGRFERHRGDKTWWLEVAKITMEQHASRAALAEAERAAITEEKPLYNIRMNAARLVATPAARAPRVGEETWTFASCRTDYEITESRIELYWEVYGDPISGDYWPDEIEAGDLLLEWWRQYGPSNDPAKKLHHYGLSPELTPIFWYLSFSGTPGFEGAPFCEMARTLCERNGWQYDNFFTYFTWPVSETTGERLRFCDLPIRNKTWAEDGDKGGFFQEALGWKPAAFQPYADFRRIAETAGIRLA